MIKINRKDYDSILLRILKAKDLREIIGLMQKSYRFGLVVLDLSKGYQSPNYTLLKDFAVKNKIHEQFITDQAKSAVTIFKPIYEDEDYYRILESEPHFTAEELRRNWLRLMKMYHPDKVGETGLEESKKINEAYNMLGDPEKRNVYDSGYFPYNTIKVIDQPEKPFINRTFILLTLAAVVLISLVFVYMFTEIYRIPEQAEVNYVSKDKNIYPGGNVGKREIATNSGFVKKSHEGGETTFVNPASNAPEKISESEKDDLGWSGSKENVKRNINVEHSIIAGGEVNDSAGRDKNVSDESDVSDDKLVEVITASQLQKQEIITADSGSPVNEKESKPSRDSSIANANNETGYKGGNMSSVGKTNNGLIATTVYGGITESDISGPNNPAKTQSPNIPGRKGAEIKLSSVSGKDRPVNAGAERTPDKSSVYLFISDYINAYRNRDMPRLKSLFSDNARENGKSIDKVFVSYNSNFDNFDILGYDIKFKKVNLDEGSAYVHGDFVITFNTKLDNNKIYKKSRGNINWNLSWRNDSWLIDEINYEIIRTRSENEF